MQIDDIDITDNILPSLYSPTRKSRTLSSKSLIDLKDEIKKIYPRIDHIESSIESIKKQIPSNLSKIFLYLSSNVQKYQRMNSFSQTQQIDINTNEDDLSDRLKEIESRLILEIDISMKKSSSEFDQQVIYLAKKNKSNKSLLFDEFSNDLSSNIQNQVKKTEKRFLQQEKRINSRLSTIEKAYEACKNDDFNQKTYQQYSNSINLQSDQIKEIKAKLEEINEIIQEDRENKNSEGDQDMKNNDLIHQKKIQKSKIKIFTANFENVQSQIQNLANEFGSSLATLNEYSQELGKRMSEISNLSASIDEKTKDLEQKSRDNNYKCQLMFKQLSEITKKSGNIENNNYFKNLSSEIKKIHEDIQKEIENIKKGIKFCEEAFPNS